MGHRARLPSGVRGAFERLRPGIATWFATFLVEFSAGGAATFSEWTIRLPKGGALCPFGPRPEAVGRGGASESVASSCARTVSSAGIPAPRSAGRRPWSGA